MSCTRTSTSYVGCLGEAGVRMQQTVALEGDPRFDKGVPQAYAVSHTTGEVVGEVAGP